MKKVLILAGHTGALGAGVYSILKQKDFDEILLVSELNGKSTPESRIRPDMSDSVAVENLFSHIKPSAETEFYLFSSIGGFTGGKSVWESDSGVAFSMISKNYLVAYNLLREFSKLVNGSAGGAAVFVSAWSGSHPETNRAAYASSKAALNHLIQAAALEGRSINMSVCGIAPFLIDTPENREWLPRDRWSTMQSPAEIGEFVCQIFRFAHAISGNIIEMGERMPLLNFYKTGV